MDSDSQDNVIYTDYQDTKNEIKDYAKGWLYHFSNYLMQPNSENVLGMKKYAIRFITKTKMSYPKFKNVKDDEKKRDTKYSPQEIDKTLEIYKKLLNKNQVSNEEYIYLNDFIYKYLEITGISDIVREKEDPATCIRRFN